MPQHHDQHDYPKTGVMQLLFRFPGTSEILTVEENGAGQKVSFHPFSDDREIIFCGRIVGVSEDEVLRQNLTLSKLKLESFCGAKEPKSGYLSKLNQVISFVKEHQLPKLVLSRRKFLERKDVNIGRTFLNLCHNYPNAFCWWFLHEGESWLGATPEILGKFSTENKLFETMSLAGTLPVAEMWSEKELQEQKPVTDFIAEILSRYTDHLEISPVYTHISGAIKHLRTDFTATLHDAEMLSDLIKDLHPTPAVCGVPTAFCKMAIENFETQSRELYSGYITVEEGTRITSFVNLRCAKLYSNGMLLFAGGGITAKSSPEKEWQETELKMQAVEGNLA